jgi:hypothetical protein
MSTLPPYGKAIHRYLTRALQDDRERAAATPVTLAGPQTNGRAPPPPGTPPTSEVAMSGTPYAGRVKVAEPEPGDELVGNWPREQLERMDQRFCERVERAFERGRESRQAAAATYNDNGMLKQN